LPCPTLKQLLTCEIIAYKPKNKKVLSNKLKYYFKGNIKLSLKTKHKIIIVTKNDIFYKRNIYEIISDLFLESNDYSVIEKMVKNCVLEKLLI
jgi:hypothetical protein